METDTPDMVEWRHGGAPTLRVSGRLNETVVAALASVLAAFLGPVLASCDASREPGPEESSHELVACTASSECGELECVCGRCAVGCVGEGACASALPDASCPPAESDAAAPAQDAALPFDCGASSAAVEARIEDALLEAAVAGCADDDDCVRVVTRTSCADPVPCGAVAPRAGERQIAAAVSEAEIECDHARSQGCQLVLLPVLCEEAAEPTCVEGSCR